MTLAFVIVGPPIGMGVELASPDRANLQLSSIRDLVSYMLLSYSIGAPVAAVCGLLYSAASLVSSFILKIKKLAIWAGMATGAGSGWLASFLTIDVLDLFETGPIERLVLPAIAAGLIVGGVLSTFAPTVIKVDTQDRNDA